MMDNKSGKGLSFVRRIYLPRVIGLGVGMLCVMACISTLDMPVWVWGLLLFNGLVWPHLAFQLARRSATPYHAEYRHLLYDSMMGGFWTATFQFNPLPSVTILSMMAMNNFAAGGQRMFFKGLLMQSLGAGLSIALLGFNVQLQTTPLQIYACLPMLTLYPMALGWVCYRLTMKLSEHKSRLSALSRTDSLTGLLNHGSWKDLLQVKFQICQQQRCQAVIALIDIDHFKRINDTFGHVVGDCVLSQLSSELKRSLREDDLAGRYGGDEFCLILPNTDLKQARQAMERLRERVSHYRNSQLPQLRISLSIGLANYHEGFAGAEAWLEATDKALYAAKNNGRNQISFAPAELPAMTLASPPIP